MMQIVVNGEARQVPEGQTVLGLLEALGLDPARVAIELDGSIVKRAAWGEQALAHGSRLEIVHFVGGG